MRAVGIIFVLLIVCANADATERPRRVLIIHSFGRDFSPFASIASTFRSKLGQLSPRPVEFMEASLEMARFDGLPNLKEDLLKGYKMNGTNYKVHLDGYNNLDYWTGKINKSARREILYYDETDLMAIRVDGWKMDIGVKHNGDWFDSKAYPSVPYITNLLMDPLEKVTPDAPGYEYEGRKFVAQRLWAPTAATPFLAAHLKSLQDFPPSQGADTLSMKKAIDGAMKKLENPAGSSN